MNLLDTASLVVTPNGYKASKLYSIVPSDGTGDMTFARTGDTATRVNASGLIESVTANKPRLDYFNSTCPKLLLEPQRTNLFLQSQDISSASWTKSNSPTIVSNVSVSPDGTTNADSIQDTTGTTFKQISQSFSVSANSTFTYSFFIKKETTRTNFCGFSLYFSGSTVKSAYACFDEVTGTAASITGGNTTPTFKVENFGTYWKVAMTLTDNGSNTNLICEFFPTASTNGTTLSTGTGSARTVWGFQLEAGAYATSYIPTTTASVTRNEDVCSKTSATALIGQTEGVMFWDGIISNVGSNVIFNLNLNGTNDRYIEITSGLAIRYIEYSTTTQASISTAGNYVTLGNRYKIAAAYKANDFVLYVNGVQIGTDTSGTVFAADKIYNGYYASGFQGLIKNNSIALWKTRLTNQELVTLTTI